MRTTRPAPRRDERAGARRSYLATTVMAATMALALAACDDGAIGPSAAREPADALLLTTEPPGITGVVTVVTAGDSVLPPRGPGDPNGSVSCPPSCGGSPRPLRAVRIEEIPGSLLSGGNKSVVTVLGGVPVLRRAGGGVTIAAFDSLRAGQRVSAWFDGPILESYPSQARARLLVIER